tara:strand:- start:359 stop:622 length:264 start_codon:yes stop_codon:yes gene_type:complete
MSKLREAAQAVIETFEAGALLDDLEAEIDALRDALAEDRLAEDPLAEEYALWGAVSGGPGGRWSVTQVNPSEIWPVGLALYVRREKK